MAEFSASGGRKLRSGPTAKNPIILVTHIEKPPQAAHAFCIVYLQNKLHKNGYDHI